MHKRIDILNLEWETDSRDTNIVDPTLVSLEDRFGYKIVRDSIWHGFFKILKYRPKSLIMSNELGAIENYLICKFAYAIGLKVIVFISEGLNYECTDEISQKKLETEMFFGHNTDHTKLWDMKLLWSYATRDIFRKYITEARDSNLKVSGATGFDSYKLLHFDSQSILKKLGKQEYKKVILLVGFAFDLYPMLDLERSSADEKTINWLYDQRLKVRDIYKELIENNRDTLFILKHHPGSINLDDTEFNGIMDIYDNTITIHKNVSIRELLWVSDIIIAFDSTVCLEAWLLGKPSILVNPEEGTFPRSWNYFGSPIVRNIQDIQAMVDEFYSCGYIQKFMDLQSKRDEIVKKQIQFDDGFNYLRAAKLIDEELHKPTKHLFNKKILKLMFLRLFRELCEFIIEKQPIPFVKPKTRQVYIKRSNRYNKNARNISIRNYREGIYLLENQNAKKVSDILQNYEG